MPTCLPFFRRLLLGSVALCAAAAAEPPPLIDACRACHGRDGISGSDSVPNLAGQKPAYLQRQLEAFRSGERKNDLMAAIAAQLGDADLQTLAAAWGPAAVPGAAAPIRSRMDFPAGFPLGFTLYEAVDGPAIVKRYANETAWQAAREGRPLPTGSALVVVTQSAAGATLSYAAMASRSGWGSSVPELLRNGDWDYALFTPERTRRDDINQAPCLACHKPLGASSHVFTLQALRAAAARQ
jgi:cytochrome c553